MLPTECSLLDSKREAGEVAFLLVANTAPSTQFRRHTAASCNAAPTASCNAHSNPTLELKCPYTRLVPHLAMAGAAAASDDMSEDLHSDSEAAGSGPSEAGKQEAEPPEFYDEEADERDEQWLAKARQGRKSDAILSCPGCFTTVCIDCQQHERYENQFRALLVMNCRCVRGSQRRRLARCLSAAARCARPSRCNPATPVQGEDWGSCQVWARPQGQAARQGSKGRQPGASGASSSSRGERRAGRRGGRRGGEAQPGGLRGL